MTYKQTLEYLFSMLPMYQRIGQAAYKKDLSNTIELDIFFKHPHKFFKSIHIAGTNGKGSVSHMIASILQTQGYKVGLYTSPHLKDYRERILVNGKKITKDFVVNFVEKVKPAIENIQPSFFELTVLMAFEYFKMQNIDIAVVETGMGGRLDSTNIITPLLSIITNISKDHTTFLGDTLPKIAKEKAGIIKHSVPVVIGEMHLDTKPVFESIASKQNSQIYFADQMFFTDYVMETPNGNLLLNIKNKNGKIIYENLQIELRGQYQTKNTITTLSAIYVLQKHGLLNVSTQAIYNGMKNIISNTRLQGRWQTIQHNPTVILDIAHNPAAFEELNKGIKNIPYKNLHFVFGVSSDKDLASIIHLLPDNANYYPVKANVPRAMEADVLAKHLSFYDKKVIKPIPNVKEALTFVIKNSQPEDLIIVTGSAFVVADALP